MPRRHPGQESFEDVPGLVRGLGVLTNPDLEGLVGCLEPIGVAEFIFQKNQSLVIQSYLLRRYDWTLLVPTSNTFLEGLTAALGFIV